MLESRNPLPKPKVHFSQQSEPSTSQSGPFHGPRIREIVTLNRPIRMVTAPEISPGIDSVLPKQINPLVPLDLKQSASNLENRSTTLRKIEQIERQTSKSLPGSSRKSFPTLKPLQKELDKLSASEKIRRCKNDGKSGEKSGKNSEKMRSSDRIDKKMTDFDEIGKQESKYDGNLKQIGGKSQSFSKIKPRTTNLKENRQKSEDFLRKTPAKTIKKSESPEIVEKSSKNGENASKIEKTLSKPILKPKNDFQAQNRSQKSANFSKFQSKTVNKENFPKITSKTPETKLTSQIIRKTPKVGDNSAKNGAKLLQRSKSFEKKENFCSDLAIRSKIKEKNKVPTKNLGLMPCMKQKKAEQSKKTKVDVLRNVSAPIPNVFVGPGLVRDRNECENNVKMTRKYVSRSSSEKLDRPEYNSIVCTIKKLEEAKKKKIVDDYYSLASTYKDLIHGKVSSALDFPACESVYHDLVDISVDENQLPARITRTRDPEPRPKDAVPMLSDFFSPQFADEYSISVNVRPRTPEIMDDWSGFRVSDKIKSWKALVND